MDRNSQQADEISQYFRDCLKTKQRSDGNIMPDIAKGDCTMMLELIRMKMDDLSVKIDPRNPGRFRGTKQLTDDFRAELGDAVRVHVPKWGATHFRGTLRDDNKRGNKRHIISLIDKLNAYIGNSEALKATYAECLRAHHNFWEGFSLSITVQSNDTFQKNVISLLSTSSLGRVQQGLVYSVLKRRYGNNCVSTKKTFAGDDQSSRNGAVLRGDVQVAFGGSIGIALEVKDAIIDGAAWERVEATHGEHNYALFLLGVKFNPAELQSQISAQENTFALHLVDFFITVLFESAMDDKADPKAVLREVIEIYNEDFCTMIECDDSIKLDFVEQ